MKLMTLNIWGAHVNDALLAFIQQSQDIDIFCFQEVYHNARQKVSTEDRWHNLNIYAEIAATLPHHQGLFRPVVDNIYGLAIFIRKDLELVAEGVVTIHDNPDYPGAGPSHKRILQWIEYRSTDQIYSILNVHGLWNGKGKTDSPERITQSKRIRAFMDTVKGPKILCGDFNLTPETESLQILAEGMNNLIKTYQVNSTRTSLYPKAEKFADYVFTSPEITVNAFQVLPVEVSDHAPLLLDFS